MNASNPIVWIVSTGTEILQGHYADTNAQWLSRQLLTMGLSVTRHMALPDRADLLRAGLGEAARQADLVITSGGLGPTGDDLDRQIIAELWGRTLIENAEAWERIVDRFRRRSRPVAENNRVQALAPEGSVILQNDHGTAPGFYLRPGADGPRATILALPGPPHEMRPMFETGGAPLITEQFCQGRVRLRTLTLHTIGLAESAIDEKVRDFFDDDPRVGFALLASLWRVDVRLTLMGADDAENDALAALWRERVLSRIGAEHVFGEDEQTLEGVVGALLRVRGETLSVAESCTGGQIAGRLTDVPGSSDYFKAGFVTYANEAKTELLGVPEETLREHGAVSPQVAGAMAEGARRRSGADWAISATGIAGPTGGTETKPVGLVYLGLAGPEGGSIVTRHHFLGDRAAVRLQAVLAGLDLLRRALLKLNIGARC